MKQVKDRIVQYANRFKLTDVSNDEVLGTFDLEAITGTVIEQGTEIDKELFDSIQEDLDDKANDNELSAVAKSGVSSDLEDSDDILRFSDRLTIDGGTV